PIFQNIDEGMLITDTSLQVIFFNEHAEKIYHIDAEDIIGQHVDTLKPSLNLEAMINNQQRLVKDKEFINGDEVVVVKGLLELAPGKFAAFAILRSTYTVVENQLNSLLQTPYEGIAVFNDNLRLLYANDVCFRFFKCNSKTELYDELASLIPRTSLQDSMSKAKPIAGEIINLRGKFFELVFLPVIRHNRSVGIIVKGIPTYRQERTWGQMIEQYNHGTAQYYLNSIIGSNKELLVQKELATKAARTISTVLVTGESGTGKEIFAHAIHNISPRRKGPFIKVNCAAVPETLLESELFGYSEGAFTGARKEGKPGKFELANHGSIFLDEIGDMSLSMQAKLLRVLQEKEVERVGSIHTTRVNVRVIAATNQDLHKLVAENKFREDLFYRLNVIILKLPPLRLRIDDVPLISNALLNRINQELGTRVSKISNEVIDCFCRYDWPGNIRELENTLERAINFCEGNTITLEHIPQHIKSGKVSESLVSNSDGTLETLMEQRERELIIATLKNFGGNKTRTAQALNIHRSVLYRKINKYDIRTL
ncbi:MAG: sigma 54-interacting transcriptional regulator, partial [Syntrophomonadaceae bacterium]